MCKITRKANAIKEEKDEKLIWWFLYWDAYLFRRISQYTERFFFDFFEEKNSLCAARQTGLEGGGVIVSYHGRCDSILSEARAEVIAQSAFNLVQYRAILARCVAF